MGLFNLLPLQLLPLLTKPLFDDNLSFIPNNFIADSPEVVIIDPERGNVLFGLLSTFHEVV